MDGFEGKEYKVFELFHDRWALVTAGNMERFNSCTIGWGSLGTLWTRPGKSGAVISVYLHPARYTCDFVKENEYFTVSFFPPSFKKALGVMGARSGRDGDKAAAAGLTPIPQGESVTYAEASVSFLCRKLAAHQFAHEELDGAIQAHYRNNPRPFPPDENGQWEAHWEFIGEIVDVIDKE